MAETSTATTFGWDPTLLRGIADTKSTKRDVSTASLSTYRAPSVAVESVAKSAKNIVLISEATLCELQKRLLAQPAGGAAVDLTATPAQPSMAKRADPFLELIEKAVDRLASDPTSLLLVTLGEYVKVPVGQGVKDMLSWFSGYGLFADKAVWGFYSRTCRHRTVCETFLELFQVQGIHMDPNDPGWAVHRIQQAVSM